MTQLLKLKDNEKILEVGTGSGYQAAILAHLVREVHTIERDPYLAERAAQVLSNLNLKNVHIHVGDGSNGLKSHAPYQAILVTAAAPSVPQTLLDQLDEGGRMVIPVGGRAGQYLEKWQRSGGELIQDVLVPVAFVPLLGQGFLDLLFRHHAPGQQQLAELCLVFQQNLSHTPPRRVGVALRQSS